MVHLRAVGDDVPVSRMRKGQRDDLISALPGRLRTAART